MLANMMITSIIIQEKDSMHFRIRGNNVQIVKTMPGEGEDSKKVMSKPVGSANINTGEIAANAKAALSEAEIKEVHDWIANHKATVGKRQQLEFVTLGDRLREVAAWVRTADNGLVSPCSDDVLEAVRELRSALVRKAPKAKVDGE